MGNIFGGGDSNSRTSFPLKHGIGIRTMKVGFDARNIWPRRTFSPHPDSFQKSGLEADRDSVSISARSTQTLICDAGPEHANLRYLLLGSASGIRLGTRIGRKILPLQRDGYFRHLATYPNTLIAGSSGRLDSQGRTVIEIVPPAGLGSSLAGLTLHRAFLVYRDNPFICSFVSNAVPVTITK